MAKTLLAGATARALGVDFRRLQFTPDMLPSDVTGTMTLRGGELVFRPGPGVRQRRAGRRDQPHAAQDAGRAAGGDAGGPGHDRRRVAPAARPVPRARHAEPDRVRGHVPAARGAARPLPRARRDRLPGRRARSARCCGSPAAGSRRSRLDDVRAGRRAPRTCARRAPRSTRPRSSDEVVGYVVALVRRTRELPSVALGASPRAAVHLLGAAKAAARLAGRDYVTPDDVARMAAAGAAPPARADARGGARARDARAARCARRSRTCRCRGEPRRRAPSSSLAVLALLRRWSCRSASCVAGAPSRCVAATVVDARAARRRARSFGATCPRCCRAACRRRSRRVDARRRRGAVRQAAPPGVDVEPRAGGTALDGRDHRARRRGRHMLPPVAARATGPLGLARWDHAPGEPAEIRVFPDLHTARRLALAVARGRFRDQGATARGPLGLGTEFELIRDYLPDDDIRQVNWRADRAPGPADEQPVPARAGPRPDPADRRRPAVGRADRERGALRARHRARRRVARSRSSPTSSATAAAPSRSTARSGSRSPPRRAGGGGGRAGAVRPRAAAGATATTSSRSAARERRKRALVVVLCDLIEEAAARPLAEAVPVLSRRHAVLVAAPDGPRAGGAGATRRRRPRARSRRDVLEARAQARPRASAPPARASSRRRPTGSPAACVAAYLRAKARAVL